MIEALIYLVIVLVIVCVVFAIALYAVDNLVPAAIQRPVHIGVVIIWALVVLLVLVQRLLPLAESGLHFSR